MKQYSDTTSMELTFAEIGTVVVGLIIHLERLMAVNCPASVAKEYASILVKFNDVLRQNEFDHYTNEKLKEFETYILEHK